MDGSPDVFIIAESLNQLVRIKHNIRAENNSTYCTVNSIDCRSKREEQLQIKLWGKSEFTYKYDM